MALSSFQTNLLRFILILIPIIGFILTIGWPDTDGYAFYNLLCVHGARFDVPWLSGVIFSLMPCNMMAYKLISIGFILLSFLVIFYSYHRFFKAKYNILFLIFSFVSMVYYFFGFEDDHLAIPLVFFFSLWYLKQTSWWSKLVYALISLFIALFLWKGAFVVMGIIFLFGLNPIASLLGSIGYVIFFGGNLWGNSLEATMGRGIFYNSLLSWILIGLFFLKRFSFKDTRFFWLLSSFLVICFIQPKWEFWLILPTMILLVEYVESNPIQLPRLDLWINLCIVIFFVHGMILFLNVIPTNGMWNVIEHAKVLQDQNQLVVNDWGVGRWFAFVRGKPTQEGGYEGVQQIDSNHYYWLGSNYLECNTIDSSDNLYLQECFKPIGFIN